MEINDWTHGNTIAALALFVSFASLVLSIITNYRAFSDKRIAQEIATEMVPLHIRAVRRAVYNLKGSVICKANNSNLVVAADWAEIDIYIKSLGAHISSVQALSGSFKDSAALLKIVRAGLLAHRHASEMQVQAATIPQANWINKQNVLISELEKAERRANRLIKKK